MKKKKIMFIVPSMRGGGSERVISTIINNIDREKFNPVLVLVKKEGKLLDTIKKEIKIIDLNSSRVRYSIIKIIKTVITEKPDIIFSTLGYLNLIVAMIRPFFKKNIKFIARESSIVSINNRYDNNRVINDFLYKVFYNNFDVIIAQSDYMKDDLTKNYNIKEHKIKVINNPVDLEKIEKLSKSDKKLFDKDRINLLSVGSLNRVKGHDLLLKALALLDERYFLTLLGEGKEKENLLKSVRKLNIENRVDFAGFKSNPHVYMKEADLFVLSSRYEGFPNVLLEAGACGTFSVAFNCPGGTNEIIEEGINGFYARCEDIRDLAEKIKKAVDFKKDKNKIKELIKERYGLNGIIKKYEEVFLYEN